MYVFHVIICSNNVLFYLLHLSTKFIHQDRSVRLLLVLGRRYTQAAKLFRACYQSNYRGNDCQLRALRDCIPSCITCYVKQLTSCTRLHTSYTCLNLSGDAKRCNPRICFSGSKKKVKRTQFLCQKKPK